ncbi:MAG: hypothetical protein OXO50_03180 [Caldilineaceae bacterium]|nr:hypothetical protein [Caldilineaceae bacterium]
MTEWERFKHRMQQIMAVPPETAAAIRRGEVVAPSGELPPIPGDDHSCEWRGRPAKRKRAR